MKRVVRIAGLVACLLGMFLAGGGHWAALQSLAWARMIVDFSRTDPLGTALAKTFDGEHPCQMCLKIRAGRAAEKKSPPAVTWEKLPEFILVGRSFGLAEPAAHLVGLVPFTSSLHARLVDSPPKPPPRSA